MTNDEPRMLGRYQLLFMLGQGGMGEVHLARLTGAAGFEKLCIVKTVLPHLMGDQSFIERFHHEAKVLVQLTHSSIAQVYDMGDVDGVLYMSIEYVPGVDLSRVESRIERQRTQMPISMAIAIGQKITEALGYAHRKVGVDGQPLGIVHRDVSPQNVMVSYEGEVKVIDFGLAKSSARSKHTLPSTVMGKLGYMSPEQAMAKQVDHRSDIFSAGIVVWEMLAGRSMYAGGTMSEMVAQMAVAEVPLISTARPEVSPALEAIVMKALARDPAQRYQRADEFARALNELAVRESMTVGSEDVGNYVRSMCPEEFAAERQLQSKLSVMRRKGAAAEIEPPPRAEMEGTFLRPSGESKTPSGELMTPAQRAMSLVQPSIPPTVKRAPVQRKPVSNPAVPSSVHVQPQQPERRAAVVDDQEEPVVLPKNRTPMIAGLLVAFIVLAGGSIAFMQMKGADAEPVPPEPIAKADPVPTPTAPIEKTPATEPVKPESLPDSLGTVEAQGRVWKVLHRADEDVVLLEKTDKFSEGQRLLLVGEAGADGKRSLYGHAAVLEVKGSFAVLLFDDEAKLPEKVFAALDVDPRPKPITRTKTPSTTTVKTPTEPVAVVAEPVKEPVREPVKEPDPAPEPTRVVELKPTAANEAPKATGNQLFGTVLVSAPNAVGNRAVVIRSQNRFPLTNCEVRLPSNVVFNFGVRVIGASDNARLSFRDFRPDSRPADPQFKADWTAIYCREGTGYFKTTFDRR